ncbi:MAG: hypothetical protein DRG09_06800 [Epsilonproteobacteria bacterium]|nr:MAG: hypothetical protein DRG09_06800 [Campylobacterota bacterium]
MKKITFFLYVAGSLLYAAPVLTAEVKELLIEAKSKVDGVTAADAYGSIDKNVIFIDARNPNEWEKGVIKTDKLVKISRGFLEIKYPKLILKKYTKEDHFIVYCTLEPRSIFAASKLKELGFTNVKYLKKGFKNWIKSDYPIAK